VAQRPLPALGSDDGAAVRRVSEQGQYDFVSLAPIGLAPR
jgi:hypothetical protein